MQTLYVPSARKQHGVIPYIVQQRKNSFGKVQFNAGIAPFVNFNVRKRINYADAINTQREWWWSRLDQFAAYNHFGMQDPIARLLTANCPPAAVEFADTTTPTRSCKLRICPSCHARRVGDMYLRVLNRFQVLREQSDVKLLVFKWSSTSQDFGPPITEIMAPHKKLRNKLKRKLTRNPHKSLIHAGVYFMRPTASIKQRKWHVQHSAVFIVPTTTQPWLTGGDLYVVDKPTTGSILNIFCSHFRYPHAWINMPIQHMGVTFESLQSQNFWTTYGELKTDDRTIFSK